MKNLKKLLEQKEVVVGPTILQILDPWIAKIYTDAGADFVYIENEEMFFNGHELANFIMSCRMCGLPVVAKSEYLDRGNIAKLLESGVSGLQLPMTESAEQIEEFISYIKFPPGGKRSCSFGVGNTDYENVDITEWMDRANNDTVVIAQIESAEGIRNIESILSVKDVDIMLIGTYDLSLSIGHTADFEHPDFIDTMDRLISCAKKNGKHMGMYAGSYAIAEKWINKGMKFIETMGDIGYIQQGVTQTLSSFPGYRPGKVFNDVRHF